MDEEDYFIFQNKNFNNMSLEFGCKKNIVIFAEDDNNNQNEFTCFR